MHFVGLGPTTYLIVVVLSSGSVIKRTVERTADVADDALHAVGAHLASKLMGKSLATLSSVVHPTVRRPVSASSKPRRRRGARRGDRGHPGGHQTVRADRCTSKGRPTSPERSTHRGTVARGPGVARTAGRRGHVAARRDGPRPGSRSVPRPGSRRSPSVRWSSLPTWWAASRRARSVYSVRPA